MHREYHPADMHHLHAHAFEQGERHPAHDDHRSLYALTIVMGLLIVAVGGFWFTPPDGTTDVFVTADEWSASISDRNQSDVIGTLQATFTRQFNPQPSNPT